MRPGIDEGLKVFMAGCFAGFTSLIVFVPSEVIKIRIQNSNSNASDIY